MGLAVPPHVAASLKTDAQRIAEHNLRFVAESARLLRTFERVGVPILFLKGMTLGALAYRDPFLKMGWDLDILVPQERPSEAGRLLMRLGYDLVTPSRRSTFKAWHQRNKESVWRHRQSGLHIELHTRVADNPALLPNITVKSPVQRVKVASQVLMPTLQTDELFAYLCVHGAASAWFRLKWAADLAGLVSGYSTEEVDRLYRRSQELGAGNAAGQALLVINQLFETPLPDHLCRELRASRPIRWLAKAALREIRVEREPTERFLGTAAIHWTQLMLRPGLDFAAAEARRQVMSTFQRT